MNVPSYQMHNVLNVYSKQLRQNMASAGKTDKPAKPVEDRVDLAPEAKRQATIEKVSRDILNKISSYVSQHDSRPRLSEHARTSASLSIPPAEMENRRFVFNTIDTINNKSRNSLSVDDSSFLIQRLDQLAKQAGDKRSQSKIRSWDIAFGAEAGSRKR